MVYLCFTYTPSRKIRFHFFMTIIQYPTRSNLSGLRQRHDRAFRAQFPSSSPSNRSSSSICHFSRANGMFFKSHFDSHRSFNWWVDVVRDVRYVIQYLKPHFNRFCNWWRPDMDLFLLVLHSLSISLRDGRHCFWLRPDLGIMYGSSDCFCTLCEDQCFKFCTTYLHTFVVDLRSGRKFKNLSYYTDVHICQEDKNLFWKMKVISW